MKKTNSNDIFLSEVLECKAKQNVSDNLAAKVLPELIENITTRELINLLNDFSFCNAEIDLDDSDSIFSITVESSRLLFFSNGSWSAHNSVDFFGVMVTLPVGFEGEFISRFNQNTKIGRLYRINKGSEATVYRVDVHLTGGVSKQHIYYMIKTFIDCFKQLYAGLLAQEGVYEQ